MGTRRGRKHRPGAARRAEAGGGLGPGHESKPSQRAGNLTPDPLSGPAELKDIVQVEGRKEANGPQVLPSLPPQITRSM